MAVSVKTNFKALPTGGLIALFEKGGTVIAAGATLEAVLELAGERGKSGTVVPYTGAPAGALCVATCSPAVVEAAKEGQIKAAQWALDPSGSSIRVVMV